jgi:hypothetical protein
MNARCAALELLPHFAENVLAGHVRTYGFYAGVIGTNPIAVGQGMHVIGGACVFACVPIAPLHFVKRADAAHRPIFERDLTEEQLILPHYRTLYIASKFGTYCEEDFTKIGSLLRKRLPQEWTPHVIWAHAAVDYVPKQGMTYFERALVSYTSLIDKLREERERNFSASDTVRTT